MSKNEYHRGTHLGYLEYHAVVASESHEQLVDDLAKIREEHSGDERYRKEQQRLLEFHNNISDRIEKIVNQTEGIKEHEDSQAVDRADKIKQSAYNAHQDEGIEEIPQNTGFQKASEWSE